MVMRARKKKKDVKKGNPEVTKLTTSVLLHDLMTVLIHYGVSIGASSLPHNCAKSSHFYRQVVLVALTVKHFLL